MSETIIALATPPGLSALAILRLCGPQSKEWTSLLCIKPISWIHGRVYYRLLTLNSITLDDVILTYHQKPRSFTGEDTVEITCHGNPLIIQKIIDAYLKLGAKPARPGEFTQRAFLNGKLDLTQAEAVADLIQASTELSLRAARAIQEGSLGKKMLTIRSRLIDLLAHLEAYIDFPDEDITPETGAEFLASIMVTHEEVSQLISTAPLGKILREGVATVIIGAPNVGKSSLFNALLRSHRAIVSPIAGTTRDLIETSCNIGGFSLRLIDTAGQRTTTDQIEAEGVLRARNAHAEADLILHVVDASVSLEQQDTPIPTCAPHQRLIAIAHKADLGVHPDHAARLAVSSLSGEGLSELESAIVSALTRGQNLEDSGWLTVNARQSSALHLANAELSLAIEAFGRNDPPELISGHLRSALQSIGEVVGLAGNEDILDALFKKFCIGK